MKPPLISLRDVTFGYKEGLPVLNRVSWDIEAGIFGVVRGPSGAGKSTLLRLLCHLEEPSSGEILFEGLSFNTIDSTQLRRQVVYIQQEPTLVEGTVRENLLLPFRFKSNGNLTPPDDEALSERLDTFLLPDVRSSDMAVELSVGQRQRLCLIRAMLLSPKILLLDEPTSALDQESARAVYAVIETLHRKEGITMLVVSHSEYMPANIDTLIVNIDGGEVRLQ